MRPTPKRTTPPTHLLPAEVPLRIKNNLVDNPTSLLPNALDGYYLYGGPGVGKSHQASAVLLAILQHHRDLFPICRWMNVPELLYQIRSSFNKRDVDSQDLIDRAKSADWLCLDDLGTENQTDWVFEVLYLIINARYEDMKTTVITSNLSLPELADRIGDSRLTSRIEGMCRPTHIISDDRRKGIHGTI